MHYDDVLTWAGLLLSFLAGFGFSLFHIALSGLSKVSLSRHLEEKDVPDRARLLETRDAANEPTLLGGSMAVIFLFI